MSCPGLTRGVVRTGPECCVGLRPPSPPTRLLGAPEAVGTGGVVAAVAPASLGLSAAIAGTQKSFVFGKNILSTGNIYNCVLGEQLIALGLSTA